MYKPLDTLSLLAMKIHMEAHDYAREKSGSHSGTEFENFYEERVEEITNRILKGDK